MTAMPNSSGSSSRLLRPPNQAALAPSRASMNDVAAPEIRNSSDSRHGDDSRMNGSSTALASGLFTCHDHVT